MSGIEWSVVCVVSFVVNCVVFQFGWWLGVRSERVRIYTVTDVDQAGSTVTIANGPSGLRAGDRIIFPGRKESER